MLKPCLLTNSPSNDYIRYPHFCFVLRELLWKFVKYSQTTITLDTPILRLSLQPRLSICIWSAHPGVCATHFHTNPPNEPDDLAYQHLKCTKPTIWSCISTSQVYQTNHISEHINRKKKTFSFGHCPNHLNPSPPWPQFGQLGPLFSEVEIQDLKVSLELRILYILYDILYICNLKNS